MKKKKKSSLARQVNRKLSKKQQLVVNQRVQEAKALVQANRLPEAHHLYITLSSEYPDSDIAFFELGLFCNNFNQFDKAVEAFTRVIEINAHHLEAHLQLASVLYSTGRPVDKAFDLLENILTVYPADYQVLITLGQLLADHGHYSRAEPHLEKALKIKPNAIAAYMILGDVKRWKNKREDALAIYRKVISLKPGHGAAYKFITKLTKYEERTDDVVQIEKLFNTGKLGLEDRRELAYALGKIYDDLKDGEKAFQYYLAGGRCLREQVKNPQADYRYLVDSIIAMFTPRYIEKLGAQAASGERLIFIVGMYRSGSTLTEQIISSHSQVFGAGEFLMLQKKFPYSLLMPNPGKAPAETLSKPELALTSGQLRGHIAEYCGELKKASGGEPVIVDTTLNNYFLLGLIVALFPLAKIIHCARDPMATCVSVFKQGFGRQHYYASDLNDLGLYYYEYQRLMAYWGELFPERIITSSYEKLIDDPENHIRMLLDQCGLEFESQCLSFHENKRAVQTPSFMQVRQPIYKKSLASWHDYKESLKPLEEGLKGIPVTG